MLSEDKRKRIRAGLDRARKNGTRSGKPIGGQTKDWDRDEARRLHAEGMSNRAVARHLGIDERTVRRLFK